MLCVCSLKHTVIAAKVSEHDCKYALMIYIARHSVTKHSTSDRNVHTSFRPLISIL
jgi:hypothetical protein